jgi:hypothetical protein
MSPHAGRFPSTVLLRSLLVATVASSALARPASTQTVDVHTDVMAVSANGDTVYALDEATGHISLANVPADLPASIAVDTMTGLRLPPSARVTAIAMRWNRLIFIDAGAGKPVLRELDPQSGAIYEIRVEVPIVRPSALAASTAGDIAIADIGQRATIWLRGKEPAQAVPWSAAGRVVHLQFDGRTLYGLDADARQIVALPPPGQSRAITEVPRIGDPSLRDLRAFAPFRGTFYLSNGAALFALAPGGTPRPVPCTTCAAAPTEVRATAQRLFVYDVASRRVLIQARPVPIGVSIETTFADAEKALAAFYAYLADRDFLRVRRFDAAAASARVVDALRDARVIIPAPEGGARPPMPDALAEVLCRYNVAECAGSRTYWNGPLAAGKTLTVPDYTINTFVRTETVDLRGTSVSDRLQTVQAVAPNVSQLEYVQNLNPESFETALARQGLVISSPARDDIGPGSIITVQDGRELVSQPLSALCRGVAAPTIDRPTPIGIPDRVAHVTFKDYVPLASNGDGSPKTVVKDGDQYVMSFRRTQIEQLDPAAFAAIDPARRFVECAKKVGRPAGTGEPLLVVEALRVEGALYDFYEPPRSVAFKQPFYLAYKAVPLSAFANGSMADALAAALPPAKLKPGGLQDLLSRRSGTLELPTTGWSLNAMVPATDLESADSPLHAIERTVNGHILFLSRELLTKTAASIATDAGEGEPQALEPAMLDQIKKERQALLEAIQYRDIERESLRPVRIAIGEANVDLNHPAMTESRNGQLVSAFWTQPSPNEPFERHEVTPSTASPRARKFLPNDHGVHVAGLIGARESSVLPGLLARAELFLIDTSDVSPQNLFNSITHAVAQGVKIFNLSLTFGDPDHPVDADVVSELRRGFKANFERQLFIVAAGDEGKDLSDFPVPPIGWVRDLRTHMIGVGLSTPDGKNFEREFDDGLGPDHRTSVSNVGQEYVQLAAPGRGVFSLGADNSYTAATGTSQAAPQVTAAAAMLSQYTANQIKARLIYTAGWLDAKGYIWGGRLDVKRAVWFPSKNLYVDKSDPTGPPIAAEFEPSMAVTIGGAERRMIEPDDTIATPPPTILFIDIMRLTTMPSGRYRVHFIDRANGNRLRVIEEADVHGEARFSDTLAGKWDKTRKEFVDFDPQKQGMDIADFIADYVARIPDPCEFRPSPCNSTIIF